MSDVTSSRREPWFLIGIFCAALLAQFYCTTLNWKAGFMPRHEFRQSQTAIICYYIDEQDNFSVLYETPIVGKPWVSILLEVPVYEWSVVVLSRATGLPHVIAARTLSLACFYLALPALYLLLGRLALPRPRRLLVLALILTCPVYIFYSRAFLMDSMEVMCCAWFLLGFVRTMDERRWSWLALTVLAATGAALIKSVTFAVWVVPAAGYGVWMLWRDARARRGWRAPLQTILWGVATVAPAFAALRWWINLTDPIKAAHASAWIFTARNLSKGNWGLFDIAARFSPKLWGILLERWQEAIMSPWIVGVFLVGGFAAVARARGRVLWLTGIFLFAQCMFPFAYAYQDYYYYSCAVFVVAAIGLILDGLLDSRLPRWCCWLVLAVPFGAQLTTYWRGYHADQILKSDGGWNYTEALRDLTPRKSVIIVAGADWAGMIPLYSQRKALMIRNGLQFDPAYLHRAFGDLAGENVSALVLIGPLRENHALLNLAAATFDFDSKGPTFSQGDTDVYLSRPLIQGVQTRLEDSPRYPAVVVGRKKPSETPPNVPFDIPAKLARLSFRNISPAPFHGFFTYGVGYMSIDGATVLSAHPDCELWLHAPADATQIKWDFGILPGAYDHPGDKTDGVEFIIFGVAPDGRRRQIYHRVLDPANRPADRGGQREVIPYQPLPGETLIFTNRPNLSASYDWAYWTRIEVK